MCGKDSCSRHFSGLSSSADGEGEIPASGANRNKWLSVLKTAICRICISIFDSFESSIFLKIDLSLVLYTAVPNMTTNCKPACCVYVWVDACIGGDISLSNVSRSRASFTIIWSYFNFLRFFLLLFYLDISGGRICSRFSPWFWCAVCIIRLTVPIERRNIPFFTSYFEISTINLLRIVANSRSFDTEVVLKTLVLRSWY